MIDRQKRLQEVYEHLRTYKGIHTQIEFAEALHYSRVYISAALNGKKEYLTDKLFKNICEAFPMTFDLDYLLTGKGYLLTIDEEISIDKLEKQSEKNYADELIASLRQQLDDKERIIRLLEQKIEILEEMQHLDRNPLKDYPFPLGTADDTKPRPNTPSK